MGDNTKNKVNEMNGGGSEKAVTEPKRKVTSKQVVAIIGIVLLVLMYIATLIAAVFDSSASGRLFWMCLFATIAIPLLIWIYTWMYGKLSGKHTMADFDLDGTEKEARDGTEEARDGTEEARDGIEEARDDTEAGAK
ncbi:MAG: hypothetical protein ACI4AB_06600 [Acetatifactor sp.]